MKLHEIITSIKGIIENIDALSEIDVFDDPADAKRKLEAALQNKGIALVIVQESGVHIDPKSPDMLLQNTLIISVLENPKVNTTGVSALEATGLILKAVHQHDWHTTGVKNSFLVDNPAYTRGELDSGLITYFCNFLVKTIE